MYNYKSRYKMKGLSVYGEPNFSILHKLDKFININKDTSILIVNAKDGIYTLPFAKKSKYIICYEENKDLLYGGIIDNFYSVGLVNRLKCNKLDSNVIIHNSNYYEEEQQEKYNFVYVSLSLNLEKNKHISIKDKVRKLKSSVKVDGCLYIYYELMIDNKEKSNSYLKFNEMRTYFDLEDWQLLYIYERPDISPHYHKGHAVKGDTLKDTQINTNKQNTKKQIDRKDKTKSPFLNEEKHNILTNELINKGYIEKGEFQIYYYDKLFQELLEENNSYKDLFAIIHYIVPRVVSRNFKDEDGYLIENKFGYFKNAIYSNINKLNFDIDSLLDNDLNDLYSEDDFER